MHATSTYAMPSACPSDRRSVHGSISLDRREGNKLSGTPLPMTRLFERSISSYRMERRMLVDGNACGIRQPLSRPPPPHMARTELALCGCRRVSVVAVTRNRVFGVCDVPPSSQRASLATLLVSKSLPAPALTPRLTLATLVLAKQCPRWLSYTGDHASRRRRR